MGLLKGKFCQFLMELSVRDMPVFLFLDNNLRMLMDFHQTGRVLCLQYFYYDGDTDAADYYYKKKVPDPTHFGGSVHTNLIISYHHNRIFD